MKLGGALRPAHAAAEHSSARRPSADPEVSHSHRAAKGSGEWTTDACFGWMATRLYPLLLDLMRYEHARLPALALSLIVFNLARHDGVFTYAKNTVSSQ